MARAPDKPGTYRVKQMDDGWRISGVQSDGTRVRKSFPSEMEARSFAAGTFKEASPISVTVDEWGVPIDGLKLNPLTAANLNAGMGIPPNLPKFDIPPPAPPPETPEAKERKKEREKRSQSLMDMVGMGWAAGTVMMGRKITENAGKEPAKPSPKQVTDLADSARDTLIDWFGDKEIKPWQMTILLTLGIPLAMLIQSPPKKLEAPSANLKSVP